MSRMEMVLGPDAVDALRRSSALVFGIGGVGSHALEALARCGLGRIGLVDFDTIAASNINRQIPALVGTVGQLKAEVMAQRIRAINPDCQVQVDTRRYEPGGFGALFGPGYDAVIDAVDDVAAKVDLCLETRARGLPFVSVMGTGNKIAPEFLTCTDIARTETCPLARVVRKRLRSEGVTSGVRVIWSREMPRRWNPETAVPGSLTFVPASAGLLAASVIVRDLLARAGHLADPPRAS
nr:tRNA threonylcarbamoyladenosine dehydratase [Phaeovibrio sulfidiphilus]